MIKAKDFNPALIRSDKIHQAVDGRTLASAIRTKKTDNLALANSKRDPPTALVGPKYFFKFSTSIISILVNHTSSRLSFNKKIGYNVLDEKKANLDSAQLFLSIDHYYCQLLLFSSRLPNYSSAL